MRVGFVLQYRRHDTVYAAMRLGDFVRRLGHEVTVFSHGTRRLPCLSTDWDRLVVSERTRGYPGWLAGCQVVVFPTPGPPSRVAAANRAGCKTVSLAAWDRLPYPTGEAFRISDTVVCPYRSAADLVRDEFALDNVVHVPWDCGLPLTRKANEDIADDRARVLFAAHCTQAARTWPEMLGAVASRVVAACPWVDATVSITPKTMAASSLSSLRRVLAYPSRGGSLCVLEDPTGWTHTPLVYGRHDLTVWPAENEGFGLVGLESLCMGTPVAAFDVPPMSELVTHQENGLLVGCELGFMANRVPYARPAWDALIDAVVNLLHTRTGVGDLRRNTRVNLLARREQFVAAWTHLLGA